MDAPLICPTIIPGRSFASNCQMDFLNLLTPDEGVTLLVLGSIMLLAVLAVAIWLVVT